MAIYPDTPVTRMVIHEANQTMAAGRKFAWPEPVTAEYATKVAMRDGGFGTDAWVWFWQPGAAFADMEGGFAWQYLPEDERGLYLYAYRNRQWERVHAAPVTPDVAGSVVAGCVERGQIQPGERWMLATDRGGSMVACRGRVSVRKATRAKATNGGAR
jgi:hypothetical protein